MAVNELSPRTTIYYIAAVLALLFVYSFFIRFLNSVTDKTTQTHAGGGFLAGLYLGYNMDPDTMVLWELVDLTRLLGADFIQAATILFAVFSLIEIILGSGYIYENRGAIGMAGGLILVLAGYLLPSPYTEAGILLLIIGTTMFVITDEPEFGR